MNTNSNNVFKFPLKIDDSMVDARMKKSGHDGGGSGMEPRIAKLESDVEHIKNDMVEIKQNIKSIQTDIESIKVTLSGMCTGVKWGFMAVVATLGVISFLLGPTISKLIEAINKLPVN